MQCILSKIGVMKGWNFFSFYFVWSKMSWIETDICIIFRCGANRNLIYWRRRAMHGSWRHNGCRRRLSDSVEKHEKFSPDCNLKYSLNQLNQFKEFTTVSWSVTVNRNCGVSTRVQLSLHRVSWVCSSFNGVLIFSFRPG